MHIEDRIATIEKQLADLADKVEFHSRQCADRTSELKVVNHKIACAFCTINELGDLSYFIGRFLAYADDISDSEFRLTIEKALRNKKRPRKGE